VKAISNKETVNQMTNIVSRCNICGKFFDSKRELREHIDKNHRITNSKMAEKE
jgi:uncharacterized C2H2 Zn-finger protein